MVTESRKTVAALVDEACLYLREAGYSKPMATRMRYRWNRLLRYARKRNVTYFSSALAERFLKSRPTPYETDHGRDRMRHAMRVLCEFAESGRHRQRKTMPRPALPDFMEGGLSGLAHFASHSLQWSKATVAGRLFWIRRFLLFLLSKRSVDGWSDLTATDLPAYVETLSGFTWYTKSTAVNAIKACFRVLFVQGLLPEPLHDRTPRFFAPRDAVLPTIWRRPEVDALLGAVDCSTAMGKRDYAILLLALRLGLRPCDIRALRLDDLHWECSTIKLVQQKTNASLQLPLSTEIGAALIDYLRHGRPKSPFREVFLRHLAPPTPFAKGAPLYDLVQRYRRKAGLPHRPRSGMSSLRHTLATRLLESNTPIETISSVLGHTSVETTHHYYLRVAPSSLRQAALDPEEETGHG